METKIKAAPLALGESTLVQHEGAALMQTKTYLPASRLKVTIFGHFPVFQFLSFYSVYFQIIMYLLFETDISFSFTPCNAQR